MKQIDMLILKCFMTVARAISEPLIALLFSACHGSVCPVVIRFRCKNASVQLDFDSSVI